jgi:pimeloyl-ACP methyl ester carboxylesterase
MNNLWPWIWFVCVGCSHAVGADARLERTAPPPSSGSIVAVAPTVTTQQAEPAPRIEVVALDPKRSPATFVLRGARKQPIVFLAGLCGHAQYYVQSFERTAARYGTVVAPQGEIPCGAGPYSTLSGDMKKLDRRIVDGFTTLAIPEPKDAVVIGYSLGATYAENLARLYPERYTRLVLIAAPAAPTPYRLKEVKSTAMLAGSLDRKDLMRRGVTLMRQANIRSSFFELPGAYHGQMGTSAERVMDEALRFVLE